MILLNGNQVTPTIFPDNTSQVWKLPNCILEESNVAHITWKFENEGEFLHLAQLADLLYDYGFKLILRLPYLPYARQDKEISNTSTFALRTFSRLLNSLYFKEVIISDPHSELALRLINNSRAIYNNEHVENLIKHTNSDVMCFPDKGARSKYSKLYSGKIKYIHGDKVRDQLTGHITNYELIGDPSGKNVLIVDDLCDAGMTFKILARDLLAKGASKVVLYVTHGLFTKGTNTLFESGIERIFTQDGEVSRDSRS